MILDQRTLSQIQVRLALKASGEGLPVTICNRGIFMYLGSIYVQYTYD